MSRSEKDLVDSEATEYETTQPQRQIINEGFFCGGGGLSNMHKSSEKFDLIKKRFFPLSQ